ncbi:sensor histidine kinase [Roseateles sp.]|uniref:sensor histidine kinase n=1 Tax=Roseateles sp. TaxID=1971397 RepID=UPI003959E394
MTHPIAALWRPTLLRRIVLALVLAFSLVGLVLLGLDFLEFQQGMDTKPGVQVLADALAASIEDLSATEDARLVVRARERETNRLRRSGGVLPGDVVFELAHGDGAVVYTSVGSPFPSSITHWVATAKAGPWQVRLAEPRLADSTVLGWLGKDMLASLLIAFPLVLLPLWVAVHRGLRPLRSLTQAVAQRPAHDLSPLADLPPQEDLRSLAEAFNDLLERLRQQRQADRELVQDAAHELRTPMAVVSAQAHLLAQAGSDEARAQAASALQSALQRASHLSQQLLTLATLDKGSLAPADALDLAALIQTQLATLAPQALARGLELSLDAPDSLLTRGERAAYESILLNLVDNALRYVPSGGHIEVSLRAQPDGLWLRVDDDGPGLSAPERSQAFQRFWRGPQGDGVSGSGLGLAIVQEACRRLGARVELQTGLGGRGLGVAVRLPLPD